MFHVGGCYYLEESRTPPSTSPRLPPTWTCSSPIPRSTSDRRRTRRHRHHRRRARGVGHHLSPGRTASTVKVFEALGEVAAGPAARPSQAAHRHRCDVRLRRDESHALCRELGVTTVPVRRRPSASRVRGRRCWTRTTTGSSTRSTFHRSRRQSCEGIARHPLWVTSPTPTARAVVLVERNWRACRSPSTWGATPRPRRDPAQPRPGRKHGHAGGAVGSVRPALLLELPRPRRGSSRYISTGMQHHR